MHKVYLQLIVFLSLLFHSIVCYSQTAEFWGTTSSYGVYGGGAIFKMDKQGKNSEVVFSPNTISIGQVFRGEWLVYNDSLAYGFSNFSFFEFNYKSYEIKRKEGPSYSGGIIKTQSGRYFGLNQTGGSANSGYLFEFLPALDSFRILHHFSEVNNGLFTPSGVLVEANNGKLYGVANRGGNIGDGGVFSYDPVNDLYEEVINNLYIPINSDYSGGFTKAQNGKLYLAIGVLMELDPSTNQVRNVINNFPVLSNRFIEASNGNLYAPNGNVVYEFNPVSESIRSVPMHFSSIYYSTLTKVSDSILYGVASSGKMFKFNLLNDSVEVTKTFSVQEFDNGFNPHKQLLKKNDSLLIGFNAEGGYGQKGNQFVYNILTDSIKVMNHIDYANKGKDVISMTLASDGNIYGSMRLGGKYNGGVIFRINPLNNNFEKLYDLQRNTAGKLLEYDSLKFISTAKLGGNRFYGGIYKFDVESNTYALSVEIDSTDIMGRQISNNLSYVSDGWYIGLTNYDGMYGRGTIFLYNPFLDSLASKYHIGSNYGLVSSRLTKIADSIFVSASTFGGLNSSGVLFKYNLSTNLISSLHHFENDAAENASSPEGDVLVIDSIIYGTTRGGQDVSESVVYSFNLSSNQFSVLSRAHSSSLSRGIVRNKYGELFGMTFKGGVSRLGTIFKVDTFNQYNVLRELHAEEGANPALGFYDFEYCKNPSNVSIDMDTIYACKNEKVKLFVDSSSSLGDADFWYLYAANNLVQKIDSSYDRTFEFHVDSANKYYVRAEGSCVSPSNIDSIYVSIGQGVPIIFKIQLMFVLMIV